MLPPRSSAWAWDDVGGKITGLSYKEASNAYSQLIQAEVLIKDKYPKGVLVDLD